MNIYNMTTIDTYTITSQYTLEHKNTQQTITGTKQYKRGKIPQVKLNLIYLNRNIKHHQP